MSSIYALRYPMQLKVAVSIKNIKKLIYCQNIPSVQSHVSYNIRETM